MNSKLQVYKQSGTLVGQLIFSESITFQYARSYLSSPESVPINPLHLPLKDGRIFREPALEGVLSAFMDALPGHWGTRVLEALASHKLSQCELLLCNQGDRIGDLVFSTEGFIAPTLEREPLDWAEVLHAKEVIEQGGILTDRERVLIERGSSQGGARPKLTVIKSGQLYLAKLRSGSDKDDNPAIEHGTMMLAKYCGLSVAETSLLAINDQNILMVKRFERVESPLPFLSLASVCALKISHSVASYLDFAEELERLGQPLDELFRRMVFNILVSNKDDHALNHGVIFDGNWRLSPVYDVVAGEGWSRGQSMIVGEFGRESSLRNALSSTDAFNLSYAEGRKICETMIEQAQDWKAVFNSADISDQIIGSVEWAILHDDIFLGSDLSPRG